MTRRQLFGTLAGAAITVLMPVGERRDAEFIRLMESMGWTRAIDAKLVDGEYRTINGDFVCAAWPDGRYLWESDEAKRDVFDRLGDWRRIDAIPGQGPSLRDIRDFAMARDLAEQQISA